MNERVINAEIPLARQRLRNAGLYIVPEARLDELAETAADAYRDYPLHNWLTNGTYDPVASKLIMKTTLVSMKEYAVCGADSSELNGFAVWIPRGFKGSSMIPFLRNGGIQLMRHRGPGIIRKLLVYEAFSMSLKKKHTSHEDWYLYNLSVRQGAQGKGIAGRLMLPMLELCDDEGTAAYLETNKEKNVRMYEHFGFELKETNVIPGSAIKHYSMVRMPGR